MNHKSSGLVAAVCAAGCLVAAGPAAATTPSPFSPVTDSPLTDANTATAGQLAFSPSGTSLAVAAHGAALGLSLDAGTLSDPGSPASVDGSDPQGLAVGGDGLVAVAAGDTIDLYSPAAGGTLQRIGSLAASADITDVAFSPVEAADGDDVLAVSTNDASDAVNVFTVQWNASGVVSYAETFGAVADPDGAVGLAFSADGSELVATDDAGNFNTWTVTDGAISGAPGVYNADGDGLGTITAVPTNANTAPDTFLVSLDGTGGGAIQQWTIHGGTANYSVSAESPSPVTQIVVDSAGNLAAVVEAGEVIVYNDIENEGWAELAGSPISLGSDTPGGVAFNPQGNELAYTDTTTGTVDVEALGQPTISFGTPSGTAGLTQGQYDSVSVQCGAAPGLTLVGGCDVTGAQSSFTEGSTDYVTLDTGTVGPGQIEVTATDNLGQTVTEPWNYTVVAADGGSGSGSGSGGGSGAGSGSAPGGSSTTATTATTGTTTTTGATTTTTTSTATTTPALGPVKHVGTATAAGMTVLSFTVPRAGRMTVAATLKLAGRTRTYRHVIRVTVAHKVRIGWRVEHWARGLARAAHLRTATVTLELTYVSGSVTRTLRRRSVTIKG